MRGRRAGARRCGQQRADAATGHGRPAVVRRPRGAAATGGGPGVDDGQGRQRGPVGVRGGDRSAGARGTGTTCDASPRAARMLVDGSGGFDPYPFAQPAAVLPRCAAGRDPADRGEALRPDRVRAHDERLPGRSGSPRSHGRPGTDPRRRPGPPAHAADGLGPLDRHHGARAAGSRRDPSSPPRDLQAWSLRTRSSTREHLPHAATRGPDAIRCRTRSRSSCSRRPTDGACRPRRDLDRVPRIGAGPARTRGGRRAEPVLPRGRCRDAVGVLPGRAGRAAPVVGTGAPDGHDAHHAAPVVAAGILQPHWRCRSSGRSTPRRSSTTRP